MAALFFSELLMPRINNRLREGGATSIEHTFDGVVVERNGKRSTIQFAELERLARADDYLGIEHQIDAALAAVRPHGERWRAFRTKLRSIKARR